MGPCHPPTTGKRWAAKMPECPNCFDSAPVFLAPDAEFYWCVRCPNYRWRAPSWVTTLMRARRSHSKLAGQVAIQLWVLKKATGRRADMALAAIDRDRALMRELQRLVRTAVAEARGQLEAA